MGMNTVWRRHRDLDRTPEDSPQIVTRRGSPPNLLIYVTYKLASSRGWDQGSIHMFVPTAVQNLDPLHNLREPAATKRRM